jgi:hypothetical protein
LEVVTFSSIIFAVVTELFASFPVVTASFYKRVVSTASPIIFAVVTQLSAKLIV